MRHLAIHSLLALGIFGALLAGCGDSGDSPSTGGSAGASNNGGNGNGNGGSTSSESGGGGSAVTSSGGGEVGGGGVGGSSPGAVWTSIPLLDDTDDDITYAGSATVTGIHFADASHGAITMLGDFGVAGSIQHLNGATSIDKIAFKGYQCDGFNDCGFLQLTETPAGLLAYSDEGAYVFTSGDQGSTFTMTQSSIDFTPNSTQVFLGTDNSGTWHELDDIGNVWFSDAAPSPTTTWTRTWQPGFNTWGGQDPNSDPIPRTDCQSAFPGTYYAFDPQQGFWMSPDGQTMIYGDSDDIGVCRSTDGGLEFQPVAFPNPPAGASGAPYVILFTDATHGLAAYGNELGDEDDSYVYLTDDAGASWQPATLPASDAQHISITGGFASPSGQTIWLVGRGGTGDTHVVLLKSSDAGATWTDISAKLEQSIVADGLTTWELHAGFALDEQNIWVGGNGGGLFHSSTGGE